MQLFFVDSVVDPAQLVTLTAADFKHAVQVLRMKVGTEIQIADHAGTAYPAIIFQIDSTTSTIAAQINGPALPNTELPLQAEIICGLPKREKADWIVQKATELGATRIIFFAANRSIMQWRTNQVEKKLMRLQQIAHDAAAQSHRRKVPEIVYWPQLLAKLPTHGLNLVAYEEIVKQHEDFGLVKAFKQLQVQPQTVRMIFGPEGGLSVAEVAALKAAAVQPVGLGPRILRTETAPLYFLSSLSYALELLK
ncbi:RsmE family RNA methyltransferase [Lapidilactobacillus bayanensis]|uniref:RsmE family RNA methyltransferase n=1 Tax=Lapidilactobacillus bayanensis TaxID=2485998 RepID=UPI000F7B611B|nr:16S rRNA (uracil(1498)-N(3))-methyltransferase [Lapidilactobacillus bayanensis]